MHYADISERVLSEGYYKTAGATPDATASLQISTSIKRWREITCYEVCQRYLRLARPNRRRIDYLPTGGDGGFLQNWKGRAANRRRDR